MEKIFGNKMKIFTSYMFAKNEKYPFFYPVNGPSGAGVTSMRNGLWPSCSIPQTIDIPRHGSHAIMGFSLQRR